MIDFSKLLGRRSSVDLSGPNFICFGAQKGGTRWLYDQLNARHDIWMPPIKELNYFTRKALKPGNLRQLEARDPNSPVFPRSGDAKRAKTFYRHFGTFTLKSDIDWYRALFSGKLDRLSGDVSPNYETLSDEGVDNVALTQAQAKFIYLVRDPVDRLWSGLCMGLRKSQHSEEDLADWARLEPILERKTLQQHSFPSLVWQRWSQRIEAGRIRFWFFDDIVGEPQQVVDGICTFIGAAPGPGGLAANYNQKSTNKKVPMPHDIRLRLSEYMAEEYHRCATVFGGHAVTWRDRNLARLGQQVEHAQ